MSPPTPETPQTTDPLADLTTLRRLARQSYEKDADVRTGQLWLAAIKTELAAVGETQARDEFERMSEEELDANILERATALGFHKVEGAPGLRIPGLD
jgi:hypothetical protein